MLAICDSKLKNEVNALGYKIVRELAESDQVRLYLVLCDPDATESLRHRLGYEAIYGNISEAESCDVSETPRPVQRGVDAAFVKGLFAGCALVLSVSFFVAGLSQLQVSSNSAFQGGSTDVRR